jgi:hypothetical protein
MIYALLQVGALLFTFEAAFFLAWGNLVMSARRIAELSCTTHFGYNARLVHSLAKQTADSWIGVVLLLAAFFLQIAAHLRGPVMSDIGPVDSTGTAIALAIGLAVFGASWVSSKLYTARIQREATEILRARTKELTLQAEGHSRGRPDAGGPAG